MRRSSETTRRKSRKGETRRRLDAHHSSLKQPYQLYIEAHSSTKGVRQEWERLIQDLQQAEEGSIIWARDFKRQGRDKKDYITLEEVCRTHKLLFYDDSDHSLRDFTKPGDRWIGVIKAQEAFEEGLTFRDRTLKGKKETANKGERKHPKIYGYAADRFDPTSGKRLWRVVPEEAELIRYVYHLFLDKKLGINEIIRKVNAEGYRQRNGKLLGVNIRRFFMNPIYAGLSWDWEGNEIESKIYSPIIPLPIYRKAAKFHKEKATEFKKGRHPIHMGAGILRCPVCNMSFTKRRDTKNKDTLYYKHRLDFKCKCERKYLLYDIANYILKEAYFVALTQNVEKIMEKLKIEIQDTESEISKDIKRFDSLVNKKKGEIENINKAIATTADPSVLKHLTEQIGKRLSEIDTLTTEREKFAETLRLKTDELVSLKARYSYENLKKFGDKKTSDPERRIMLKEVISKALVHKNTIEIVYIDGRKYEFDYSYLVKHRKDDKSKLISELLLKEKLVKKPSLKDWEKMLTP